MNFKNIPKPPNYLIKYYGNPRYENEGYILDNHAYRWRYDKDGLKGFIVYAKDGSWKDSWFRENG